MKSSKVDKEAARDKGAGVKKEFVATSTVELDKYIAAVRLNRMPIASRPAPRANSIEL